MSRLLALVGATVVGAIGWALGESIGIFTAVVLSAIGSGVGFYLGRLIAERLVD